MSAPELAQRLESSPASTDRVEQHGPYLCVLLPPTDALASGPQAYIVDGQGRVVAFCDDLGDSPSFRSEWMPDPGQARSRDDALTLLRQAVSGRR